MRIEYSRNLSDDYHMRQDQTIHIPVSVMIHMNVAQGDTKSHPLHQNDESIDMNARMRIEKGGNDDENPVATGPLLVKGEILEKNARRNISK